jgi:ElaB/YqjD/DUF883 family membrane-anchored ribosome-binding protein
MSEYNPSDRYIGSANDADDKEWTGQSGGTQDALNAARARLNAAYEATREKSTQALKQAEDYVRKSPLEAVGYAAGIAAVVGLVAGLLLGRKD